MIQPSPRRHVDVGSPCGVAAVRAPSPVAARGGGGAAGGPAAWHRVHKVVAHVLLFADPRDAFRALRPLGRLWRDTADELGTEFWRHVVPACVPSLFWPMRVLRRVPGYAERRTFSRSSLQPTVIFPVVIVVDVTMTVLAWFTAVPPNVRVRAVLHRAASGHAALGQFFDDAPAVTAFGVPLPPEVPLGEVRFSTRGGRRWRGDLLVTVGAVLAEHAACAADPAVAATVGAVVPVPWGDAAVDVPPASTPRAAGRPFSAAAFAGRDDDADAGAPL